MKISREVVHSHAMDVMQVAPARRAIKNNLPRRILSKNPSELINLTIKRGLRTKLMSTTFWEKKTKAKDLRRTDACNTHKKNGERQKWSEAKRATSIKTLIHKCTTQPKKSCTAYTSGIYTLYSRTRARKYVPHRTRMATTLIQSSEQAK